MIRFGKIAVAAAAALFAATALSQGLPTPEADAEAVHRARIPLKVPDKAAMRPNPVPPMEESLDRGKRLFNTQCTMCHGATGDGTGALAEQLKMEMPNFTDRKEQTKVTDGELFWVLENGHGRMPKEDRLPEEWKWDLVNHIRTLGPNE
jgi:mono/diheme cytochrome c family protein